jgi:hypothetical protein
MEPPLIYDLAVKIISGWMDEGMKAFFFRFFKVLQNKCCRLPLLIWMVPIVCVNCTCSFLKCV